MPISYALFMASGGVGFLRCPWTRVVSRAWSKGCALVASAMIACACVGSPVFDEEAPRVKALLEQAWAVEAGRNILPDQDLALALYLQAGQMGSGEAYFRAAQLMLRGNAGSARRERLAQAKCLLASASQLGHQRAGDWLAHLGGEDGADCEEHLASPVLYQRFDLDHYVAGLPMSQKRVVALIRRLAPVYAVDTRLALAVASVESNFNIHAVSPKNAMGVMQLIPETAERFNVRRPFDPEQNIRGGLAYLKWLGRYYTGDVIRVVAAYNAGEKAVDNYGGIPPYRETMAYVARVLGFARAKVTVMLPAPAAGRTYYRDSRAGGHNADVVE